MDIAEIYSKSLEDVDYKNNVMEVSDTLEAYMNQIRNILFTATGRVMGAVDLPADLEQFLFTLGVNTTQIERFLYEKIKQHSSLAKNFDTRINVADQRLQGAGKILVMNFVINGVKRLGFTIKK